MSKDQLLWDQLRAGDKTALASIYQDQVDALFRYGCQFTPDQGLVQDCIQDLFIELWKNRASIGSTDAIRQYLLVSLRRKVVRQLKKGSTRQDRGEAYLKEAPKQEAAADQRLVQEEETTAQSQMISQALSLLSDRQREVLYLKYFEEMEYKEIAKMIGINYQSIRNTASAGLKALRNILGFFLLFFIQL